MKTPGKPGRRAAQYVSPIGGSGRKTVRPEEERPPALCTFRGCMEPTHSPLPRRPFDVPKNPCSPFLFLR